MSLSSYALLWTTIVENQKSLRRPVSKQYIGLVNGTRSNTDGHDRHFFVKDA